MATGVTAPLDLLAIKGLIPHRYPFLLVDRVAELTPGERVVALKNLSANEPFFEGHFPDFPVMPGVLILESLAQAGALMMLAKPPQDDAAGTKIPFFAGADKVKFRRQVVPGDQLRLEVTIIKSRGDTCRLDGKAYVGEELAAQAEILAVMGSPG